MRYKHGSIDQKEAAVERLREFKPDWWNPEPPGEDVRIQKKERIASSLAANRNLIIYCKNAVRSLNASLEDAFVRIDRDLNATKTNSRNDIDRYLIQSYRVGRRVPSWSAAVGDSCLRGLRPGFVRTFTTIGLSAANDSRARNNNALGDFVTRVNTSPPKPNMS